MFVKGSSCSTVECINFKIEKHQMKNSMNNVPTFGNKTKPKPTQLSSSSQSHRTLIIQWEDIENAFVTIENRLSIVFIFMVIVAAEVTWAQSMDRGKLLEHFDLFFSFDFVASGFYCCCCCIWFGAQGLKLFSFSKLILHLVRRM